MLRGGAWHFDVGLARAAYRLELLPGARYHNLGCRVVARSSHMSAHRWKWINDGQYEHASRMVAEIGRLLGGWLRQSQGAASSGRK